MSVGMQIFVGLCRAPARPSGKWVCLDGAGRPVREGSVAWSRPAVGQLLDGLKVLIASGVEVTLGVDAEDGDQEVASLLGRSGLPVKAVERWMVEALWRSQKRRRQTLATRACCLAQVLLIADCPPGRLAGTAGEGGAACR